MSITPVIYPEGINPASTGGGGGGTQDVFVNIFSFNHTITSPLDLFDTVANEYILEVRLHIVTPFDGMVTFTVGEAGGTDRLMDAGDNDPTESALYVNYPNYQYAGINTIRLYATLVGVTTGSGVLYIYTKQE